MNLQHHIQRLSEKLAAFHLKHKPKKAGLDRATEG